MKLKRCLPLSLLSLLLVGAPAFAAVQVHLSQNQVQMGQVFQVSVESSGSSVSPPDLSRLQADFEIVNRSVRQQSSVINGRRSQRLILTLSLAPRRSGRLQIPSLDFGDARSPTRAIEVLAAKGHQSRPSETMSSGWSGIETQLPSFPPPETSEYRQPAGPTAGWPGAQDPWSQFEIPAPVLETPPVDFGSQAPPSPYRAGGLPQQGPSAAAAPRESVETGLEIPERFQPRSQGEANSKAADGHWLVGTATTVLLGLLLLYWLKRRRPRSGPERVRTRAPTPPPQDPTVQALQLAFQQRDAAGARQALLHWACETWPEDPPANLSRLAVRMPAAIREAILKLDQAQYSPTPVDWKELQAWELSHLAGSGAAGVTRAAGGVPASDR